MYLEALDPTMSFTNGDLVRIPCIIDKTREPDVSAIVEENIKALIAALHRYKGCNDNMLLRLIRATGPVSEENINKLLRVYKSTMEDVSMSSIYVYIKQNTLERSDWTTQVRVPVEIYN